MDWKTIAASAVVATVISGIVSLITAVIASNTARRKELSDKAWADYELRRDRYFRIAELISCLFENGNAADRPEFHRTARAVRLVGSDEVVDALNRLTAAIKEGLPTPDLNNRYRELFNAMRQDIRRIDALPPRGTALGPDAFPIES